ncbi:MAG: DUF1844 domain-containing protein [Deltaproteobacteria bacterium]|nr:DUF1844 domain-containing protein [Deltaproteobacteria bacterium]
MSEEQKDFVVKDRRRFSPEGEPKEETEHKAADSEQAKKPTESEAIKDKGREAAQKERRNVPLPEMNFSTFIFSLSSSAMMHLGEIPDPNTNTVAVDLPLAKQTIDILGMLKEKTKGNLQEDEERLLEHFLYDLRLMYVAKRKS